MAPAFTYLKLENHKGLNECLLRDLGKINIICGRNNNGKSTLLEAVSTKNLRLPGRILGADELESLHNSVELNISWQGSASKTHRKSEVINKVLQECLATKEIWYEGDLEQFREIFDRLFSRTGARWTSNAG